jgi:hypothetical protein
MEILDIRQMMDGNVFLLSAADGIILIKLKENYI